MYHRPQAFFDIFAPIMQANPHPRTKKNRSNLWKKHKIFRSQRLLRGGDSVPSPFRVSLAMRDQLFQSTARNLFILRKKKTSYLLSTHHFRCASSRVLKIKFFYFLRPLLRSPHPVVVMYGRAKTASRRRHIC